MVPGYLLRYQQFKHELNLSRYTVPFTRAFQSSPRLCCLGGRSTCLIMSYQPLSQDEDNTIGHPPTCHSNNSFSSSVDGDEERLLDKDLTSNADIEHSFERISSTSKRDKRYLRYLILCISGLVSFTVIIALLPLSFITDNSVQRSELRHITLDNIYDGTFQVERQSLNWVAAAEDDGVYSTSDDGAIKLVNIKRNTTTEILKYGDVQYNNTILSWSQWMLSPDLQYVLLKTDQRKQWRLSSHGNYYIHRLHDHVTYPIAPPSIPARISYATWSPTGNALAYVLENDLYVLPSAEMNVASIRVTSEGNSSLFFGVPDWVYEEEVFSSDYALWWSLDSRRIAFLRSDETQVNDYTFPIYNPSNDANAVYPYTNFVTMKYPKPGYSNPLVTLHIFDLDDYQNQLSVPMSSSPSEFIKEVKWVDRQDLTDSIIQEVVWVANATLLIKEVNRAADRGSVIICDIDAQQTGVDIHGTTVRELGKAGEQNDDGWIDYPQNVRRLPEAFGLDEGAYVDIIPSKEGYNQLVLFTPAGQSDPIWLTSGQDEVVEIFGTDAIRRRIYYLSAIQPGTGRDPYYIIVPQVNQLKDTAFTPVSIAPSSEKGAYYGASFSPLGGYYVLSYDGPNIPWQKLINVNDVEHPMILTNNSKLADTVKEFYQATFVYSTIENEGYEMNAVEIRPPNMDESGKRKYPVLFQVYGGPGSQTVAKKFSRDWHNYLACTLQYIVVVVDGRGTGFKGRKFRNPVRGNLGYFETKDQIDAARLWASKPYVDASKIGIWGWSYGGFMAAKVAEAGAEVHSLAMSVAPVTSWLLYDTIYTERYMGLPQNNPEGYHNASISDVSAFSEINYLLAHGSGDDNVHFANTAHLIDMFTASQIRNYSLRVYTDSDHWIDKRGANREVYQFLTDFLVEHWGIRRS